MYPPPSTLGGEMVKVFTGVRGGQKFLFWLYCWGGGNFVRGTHNFEVKIKTA